LQALPVDAQKLVTATNMSWQENGDVGRVFELSGGTLRLTQAP
jgi:hypothetical protein